MLKNHPDFQGMKVGIFEYLYYIIYYTNCCSQPYGTTQNKWDSIIDFDDLWQQYHRIVKPNGAIVLTGHGLFTAKLILSNEKYFKYKIIWEKSKSTNFLNAKKQPLRKHEDICVFYRKQPTYDLQSTNDKW